MLLKISNKDPRLWRKEGRLQQVLSEPTGINNEAGLTRIFTFLRVNPPLDDPLIALRGVQMDNSGVRSILRSRWWVIQRLIHVKEDDSFFHMKGTHPTRPL